MPWRSRARAVLAVLGLAVTVSAATPPPASADAEGSVYVALGDSWTAGPLIPLPDQPWGCIKSTNNYPKLLAARLGLSLVDVSCSGARTAHMSAPQNVWPEPNPPQLDALHAGVQLVSLQIGGNDIGFSDIAETCARAGLRQESCRDQYVDDEGNDELRNRIAETAPRVAAFIQAIHERAPAARVLVLGYSGIFRIGPGPASCPAMGVGEGDAQYLRGIHEELNAMIEAEAVANGATYVDVYWPSEGMTACDLPVVRWVEPVVPANAAAPIHPNLMGMLGVTDLLEQEAATEALAGGA